MSYIKSKGVILLNLPRIRNHSYVTCSISKEFLNCETPSLIYTFQKSIQSKIFDLGSITRNIVQEHRFL